MNAIVVKQIFEFLQGHCKPQPRMSGVGLRPTCTILIALRFAVFQSLLASCTSRIHCLRHVVHCTYVRTLTAMQSYVTSHVKLQCANIRAHLNRNGIRSLPDVLFPTEGRGEKSARHETMF